MTAEAKKLLISYVDDIHNIYHLFVGEMDAIWKATGGSPDYSILLKYYENDAAGRWRVDLLKSIYRNVYIHDVPDNAVFEDVQEIKEWVFGMVDNQTFSHHEPSPFHMAMIDRVKEKYGIKRRRGKKVVYVERGRSRILFDKETRLLLRDFLTDRIEHIDLQVVNFDNSSFEEQLEILSEAKIMLACHGAANTNLFLLPQDATLFEVNFRRYWFCDPVCARHMTGEIDYKTDCGGPLTWRDTFHKAEYHNLAQIYNIGYKEFEISDAETFLNDNPIELEKIYVDGEVILKNIRAVMLNGDADRIIS